MKKSLRRAREKYQARMTRYAFYFAAAVTAVILGCSTKSSAEPTRTDQTESEYQVVSQSEKSINQDTLPAKP